MNRNVAQLEYAEDLNHDLTHTGDYSNSGFLKTRLRTLSSHSGLRKLHKPPLLIYKDTFDNQF